MDLQNFEHYAGSGNPLVGATVKAYVASLTTPNPNAVTATTLTDANGMWSFTGLTDGQVYDVKVELPGVSKAKWYRGLVKIGLQQVSILDPSAPIDNPILNGNFYSWPTGTSFAAIAHASYHADNWSYSASHDGVLTIQRSTDVPAVAATAGHTNYSLHIDVTTADTSLAAGQYASIYQSIEGFVFQPFWQKAFTLSFWVKATKTGVYSVAFRSGGGDRTYIGEYTVNAADTWEYKYISVPASPSTGSWNNWTTDAALMVRFTIASAPNLNVAAGSWQTASYIGGTNQVNALDSTSNDFKLWGVRITPGTTPQMFVPRNPALEDLLLARYFQRLGGVANIPFGSGYVNSASQAFIVVPYFPMRIAPTPSLAAAGKYTVSSPASSPVGTSVSSFGVGVRTMGLTINTAAVLTTGQGCYAYATDSAGLIDLSARF